MPATHRCYDSVFYVLLLPFGTDGFELGDTEHHAAGRTVTMSDWYAYHIHCRPDSLNAIPRSGRLKEVWLCDAWARAEKSRLDWARFNQKKLKAEKYHVVVDASRTTNGLEQIGQHIVLPPTITGTPRWYKRQYQDAMAIVRDIGKPSYFITITCNPNWPEIKRALFPGEQPGNRPEVLAKVFKIRLDALMHDLLKRQVLGKVIGHFYVIEYQKRGLPHAHILLFMEKEDLPSSPEVIDTVICAELPNRRANPLLYACVTKHMLHGPCGDDNLESPCMEWKGNKKECTKEFPKDFEVARPLR